MTLDGPNNTVTNNVIHDVDWSGVDGAFVDTSNSANNTITNNTMYNAGRSGVIHYTYPGYSTANTTIANNDISRFGYLTQDVGGTYGSQNPSPGTLIAYNRIHDARTAASDISVGMYMDNGAGGATIDHNLVYNVQRGVTVNLPNSDENVYNNTFWGVSTAMTDNNGSGGLTNVNTYNNLTNAGPFVGTSMGTNLTTTTNQFVNSAAGNYTLKSTSSAIDAGTVIPGITDGYQGSAPDIGAFEYGPRRGPQGPASRRGSPVTKSPRR